MVAGDESGVRPNILADSDQQRQANRRSHRIRFKVTFPFSVPAHSQVAPYEFQCSFARRQESECRGRHIASLFLMLRQQFRNLHGVCRAPLRRLSDTHQKVIAFGFDMSFRMRPMKTASLPSHVDGIGY